MPDLPSILRQYGVSLVTHERGDRHVRHGWLGVPCPFCTGSPGLHLGYNIAKDFWNCWRCGFHSSIDVVQKLAHVDRSTAIDILRSVDTKNSSLNRRRDEAAQIKIGSNHYRRPSGVTTLTANHARYLENRGFDPNELEREWRLESTGPVSALDKSDYRHRLFIPIYWGDKEVSFQTRDVTGRAEQKYKACPLDRELVPHKKIIYRHPEYNGNFGIAVEGPADAWRFGPSAFALSGILYKIEQVLAIASLYDTVAVVFDPEPVAQKQAEKLACQLDNCNVRVSLHPPIGGDDPGAMREDDARHFVRELTNWAFAV